MNRMTFNNFEKYGDNSILGYLGDITFREFKELIQNGCVELPKDSMLIEKGKYAAKSLSEQYSKNNEIPDHLKNLSVITFVQTDFNYSVEYNNNTLNIECSLLNMESKELNFLIIKDIEGEILNETFRLMIFFRSAKEIELAKEKIMLRVKGNNRLSTF